MSRSYRTNLFMLIMMIHQIILSFFWYYIVFYLNLGFVGQMIATQVLIFIIPAFIMAVIMKEPLKEIFSIHPLGWRNFLLIFLISIFIQPIMSLLSVLSSMLFPNVVSDIMMDTIVIPLPGMILAMAVMPAIGEELFFRGLIFSGYKNIEIKKACLMTGFFFGLMHLDGQQFFYAFAMGVIFCYFVYKTHSIFASMLSHFTINASQLLLSRITEYAADANSIDYSAVPTREDYILAISAVGVLIVFTLPILILCFWFFHKINKPEPVNELEILSVDIFDYSPITKYEEKLWNLPAFFVLVLYFLIVFLIPIVLSSLY